MKTQVVLSAVAAAVVLFSQAALAQSTAPVTRAEVKSEAKSGAPRTGDAPVTAGSTASGPTSTKTRAERKGETKADAYARLTCERYRIMRTQEWTDEVLDRLRGR